MTVASFIASQRTDHGVSHALSCRALEVPESTFLQVAGSVPDAPPGPPDGVGRRGEGVVRRLGRHTGHLRVAPGVGGPGRGRLAGIEEDGGRLDDPPGFGRPVPETEAAIAHPPRQRLHRSPI